MEQMLLIQTQPLRPTARRISKFIASGGSGQVLCLSLSLFKKMRLMLLLHCLYLTCWLSSPEVKLLEVTGGAETLGMQLSSGSPCGYFASVSHLQDFLAICDPAQPN